MKVRKDFVTNSSSSSFVISRDNISYDKLLDVLLEIANKSTDWLEDEEGYVDYNEISYKYEIRECTHEQPYEDYNYHEYDNHFIVENNCYCRYDWDVVESVLAQYGIPWTFVYCD